MHNYIIQYLWKGRKTRDGDQQQTKAFLRPARAERRSSRQPSVKGPQLGPRARDPSPELGHRDPE